MQTIGYTNYASNSNNEGSTFERTNYALKESVNKEWRLYNLSGMCEIKPYPVFIDGQPCASRNPSSIESVEGFDPNNLQGEDGSRYHSEIIPDAYIQTPLASYVGVTGNHYTFIDECSNTMQYAQNAVDPSKVRTPYSAMVSVLFKGMPKQGEAPAPGLPACLLRARAEGTMSYSKQVVLFRGMLLKFKGQSMNSKNAVQGTLPKVVFALPQKSAVDAFIRAFRTKANIREPLSANNSQMTGSLNLDGTVLSFTKSNYQERNSDYLMTPVYNAQVNHLIGNVWNAQNEAEYYANLYQSFGACQNLYDALEIMTVEDMITLLRKAFPASWIWYGLRDTPYAPLVQDLMQAAAQDIEMTNWFNPPQNNGMNNNTPSGIPQNAYVSYQPQSAPVAPAAPQGYVAPPPAPPIPQQSMRASMPSLKDLPPQAPVAMNVTPQEDAVPMNFSQPNEDQQKADDAMARIRARVNGGK